MKHPSTLAIAALAAVLAGAPAWADQAASASLTGLTYTLYDLDPSDGVAPAITFAGDSGYPWDSVGAHTSGSGHDVDSTDSGFTALAPIAAQISVPGVTTAAASVSGTLEGGGATIQASATSAAPSHTVATASIFGNNANSYFTLTQETMVVFNATATLSATSNDPHPDAHASASLELLGGGYHQAWSGDVSAGQNVQETFSLSLVNPTSLYEIAYFDGNVQASTIAASPVPEPAPAGLLLAGLALLGTAGRRVRPLPRG